MFNKFAARNEASLLLVARVALALIFLIYGFGKVTDPGGFAAALGHYGVPLPWVFAVIGTIIEFLGAIAIIVGFQTRPVAAVVAIYTIAAALIGHHFWTIADPKDRYWAEVNFWKNVSMAGGFLLLFVRGAGRLSIDRR